jgi:hypothetical protein
MVMDKLSDVEPGDYIHIDGHEFKVGSKTVQSADGRLTRLGVMAVEHDPLTDKTVSSLIVDTVPFKLEVCNGPTYEIAPGDVEV